MPEKRLDQELTSEPTESTQHDSENGKVNGKKKRSSTRKTTPKQAASHTANGAKGSSPKKSASPGRRRAAKSSKKQAEFEPDLDPTPVKAKDTRHRSWLSFEAELDALLSELESEAKPSEFEDTMKRPALLMPRDTHNAASSEVDPTPAIEAAPVEASATPAVEEAIVIEQDVVSAVVVVDPPPPAATGSEQDAPDIPETILDTPLPPVDELIDIPITPLPPVDELLDIPVTPLPPVDELLDIPVTPLPPVDELLDVPITPLPPVITIEPPAAVIEPPAIKPVPRRPLLRRPAARRAMALLSLMLLISSSLLLWQNVNATHLYLYHIDPGSGKTLAQQDLGAFQDVSSLTNPALDQSSLLLGVSSTQSTQQQVLSLSGSDTSWNVTHQFSAPPGRSTLSIAPGHVLVVAGVGGLQVMTGDGRALWQAPGDAPVMGAHAFAPAFDNSTVYSVKSARQGIVAAYDLQNGTQRWTQQLKDTLAYAPPLLLVGETLYIAGDHSIYALNRSTGIIAWQAAAPSRTLLFDQASQPEIIAVGATGLTAFNALNGAIAWSFNGQPRPASSASTTGDTLTDAQFYQAGLSTTNNTLYTTGIVWDEQQAQQQLWLFAVDASTGTPRWSERVSVGFTGADAGRVLAPFVDAIGGLVILEQARADGSHSLSAFDSGNGSLRWSMRLAGVTAAAPNMIQVANNTLSIFSAQTDAVTALRSSSWLRLLLLILALGALFSLILLWILPFKAWRRKMRHRLHSLPLYLIAPLKWSVRLWRFSRLLFALTIVAAGICSGILTYTQLNREQSFLNHVGASNGKAMWQHTLSSPATLVGADDQGGLLVTAGGDHTYQLSALDSAGSTRWIIPSGEATFSFPQVATQPGVVLAALHGPAALNYRYAPDDPAYQNPLAHFLTLYLLDSSTGHVLWGSNVIKAGELQDAALLGADGQFIYIAARALQGNQVTQLIAIDKTSGAIAWRVFGPRQPGKAASNFGALLMHGRFIYWQVEQMVYALDTLSGQIQWRDAIAEANANFATLEEGQMATGGGILLIRRSDVYHALDLVNGVERWTLSGLGIDSPRAPGGIVAAGNEFILYGGGTIEAFDTTTRSILWNHNNLVAVSDVTISQEGSLVYAVVFNNFGGSVNQQSLVAFDVKTNLVHWTFQPGAQAQLVYAGSRIISDARGMLFVTTCLPGSPGNCSHQTLYGIDGNTGAVRWKLDARSISPVLLSRDGNTITFQTNSSAWENLKAMFKG